MISIAVRGLSRRVGVALIGATTVLIMAMPSTAAGAVGVASTPSADCASDPEGPTLQGISPSAVSVGIQPVNVYWAPAATDPCGIAGWAIYRGAGEPMSMKATNSSPVALVDIPPHNWLAGWSDLWLSATDGSANRNVRAQRFGVQLLRRTTFELSTFEVTKPSASSTTLGIHAKLIRANWQRKFYDYFPGEHVMVQFLPQGSSQWQHKQTLTTNGSAQVNYSLNVKGLPPSQYVGSWRLRYLGGPTSASTTSTTYAVRQLSSASGAKPLEVKPVAAAVAPEGVTTATDPAVAAPPASTQTDCTTDRTPPSGVQVSVNGGDPSVAVGAQPVPTTFAVQALDPCGTGGWDVGHAGFGAAYPYGFSASNTRPTAQISAPPANALAGYSDLYVSVTDGSAAQNPAEFLTPIRLARHTLFSAGDTRVDPPSGSQAGIVISGRLVQMRWDVRHYFPFAGQQVAVQFLPTGSTRWQHVKFARTDALGWVHTSYWRPGEPAATFNGQWRLHFPAQERYESSTSAPVWFTVN